VKSYGGIELGEIDGDMGSGVLNGRGVAQAPGAEVVYSLRSLHPPSPSYATAASLSFTYG